MSNRRYTVVDRRGNSGDKNTSNRQRFIRRTKEDLKRSVRDGLQDRSITSDDDQGVNVPTDGIREPSFRHDHTTGDSDFILPGNEDFVVGDNIRKPPPQGGGSGQGEASDSGEGDDEFDFTLSKEEYYDILFEDLELPDMVKKSEKKSVSVETKRAGFTNVGSPANLDLLGTMRKSVGRRIALKKPKEKELAILKEEFEALGKKSVLTDDEIARRKQLIVEMEAMTSKVKAVSYIDPIDLRFRNYEKVPIPKSQALMVCVMDVSGSMGQHEKDLAKRFYILLYMFLQRKYQTIDVVFIRHHSTAMECTEEEFFYSRETGGTIVSTGFEEMARIQQERYPIDEWNIYCAQASDGDNFNSDNPKLTQLMDEVILPMVQYFCYIEVGGMSDQDRYYSGLATMYGLWPVYQKIKESTDKLVMKKVQDPKHVYSVFRELFSKDEA